MFVTMLKKIISATLAIGLAMAVTTNAYAAENILDFISAGAARKLAASSDAEIKMTETASVMNPEYAAEEPKAPDKEGVMKVIYLDTASSEADTADESDTEEFNDISAESIDSDIDDGDTDVEEDDSSAEDGELCVADVDDLMNVRKEPSEDAGVAGYMYKDCVGEILEKSGDWTKIRSGRLEGWAKNDYLLFGKEAKQKTDVAVLNVAVINADGLRVRAEASEDSEVKAMLAEGDEVEVLDTGDEDWIEISFEDGTSGEDSGYISGEYVSLKASYKTGETIEEVKEREEKSKAAREESEKKDKEEKKNSSDKEKASSDNVNTENSSKPETANTGAVSASVDDETLLAALIQCECNGPYEAQLAVGSVVVNRAKSGYGSISNAIYAPYQFGPASSGKLAATISSGAISGTARQAARDAISGVSNVGGAKYFRNVKSGHPGIVIGNHVYW